MIGLLLYVLAAVLAVVAVVLAFSRPSRDAVCMLAIALPMCVGLVVLANQGRREN
jgi:hypothetical protein